MLGALAPMWTNLSQSAHPVHANVRTLKNLIERAVIPPVTKPLIHRQPRAELLWQVVPGCTRVQYPKVTIEHQGGIIARSSHFVFGGNQICGQLPS